MTTTNVLSNKRSDHHITVRHILAQIVRVGQEAKTLMPLKKTLIRLRGASSQENRAGRPYNDLDHSHEAERSLSADQMSEEPRHLCISPNGYVIASKRGQTSYGIRETAALPYQLMTAGSSTIPNRETSSYYWDEGCYQKTNAYYY